MVRAEAKSGPYLDKALSRFLAACKSGHHQDHIKHTRALQPAGAHLERLLVCDRRPVESVELYEAFIQSLRIWTKNHCCTHEAALWLHHPTAPKVDPAIDLIRAGTMAKEINKASLGKRKRCVEICLETARQCLAKEQFHDAQFVLEFARDNFPDLLDTDGQLALPTESNDAKREQKEMREREEDVNLRLLDRLLPT
ncbi:hypothetical protein M011DRAFT_407098 [Sporormia fimetaria CBS 119925]|uniref:Uncharacterized protein n=1 Tax=Sporormia fimetaria CBS 119925 TaxID=1340428 RepID=A0A6A6V7Q8_9PLEO|nr:hypothetical protein M011DRAFT_407098 [Sporormia fimetaria CBS 119925]